jgi:hypothetical protein
MVDATIVGHVDERAWTVDADPVNRQARTPGPPRAARPFPQTLPFTQSAAVLHGSFTPPPDTRGESKGTTMRRPTVNITPTERAGRIVLGGAAAVAGVVLLASAGGALAVVLLLLLVLAGLDLVVTGALGHCPLYAKLGHVPRSLTPSH